MRMKILVLVAVMSLYASNASAKGCDCGTIQGMLMMTEQKLTTQINAHTTMESKAIQTQILQAARNIIGRMKTDTAAILKAIQDLKEAIVVAMTEVQVAAETKKIQDTYHPEYSKPDANCGAEGLGGGFQVGSQATSAVQGGLQQHSIEHADKFRKPAEYTKRITAEDHPTIQESSDALFPPKKTLTQEEVAKAAESVNTAINPRPTPALTDDQKKTAAGEAYSALRQVTELRQAIISSAMNRHVAFNSPSLPDEISQWAKEQWKAAGASGEVPGVVDGKMSQAALFNVLSQLRLGNPKWHDNVLNLNDTGLMRESLNIEAVKLELLRQNNELLDEISVLLALHASIMLETNGKAMSDDAYQKAIGAQQ